MVTAAADETRQVMAPGQPLVAVARMDALDVVFALPEQDRETLSDRQASAVLWRANQPHGLTLRDISADVDPASRTHRVRMAVGAPDAAMALGRTGTITLTQSGGQLVAMLPLAAGLNDDAGATVRRLTSHGQTVEAVPVKILSTGATVAHLHGPLAESDRVVNLVAQKIDPTRPARVVETATTPEPGPTCAISPCRFGRSQTPPSPCS